MFKRIFSALGSSLQTPIGAVVGVTALWHIVAWVMKFHETWIPIPLAVSVVVFIVDAAVALYLLDKLTYFFSQFVLPIQNPKYRQEIYERVKGFQNGARGPALFVKNGRVIMHEGEEKKRGSGLIVLDTASAIVLRTDSEITGAAGPGIRFTNKNEYIAGSVDLRNQMQIIGPLKDDQWGTPTEQNLPDATKGLTRDGFEVTPTISIKFCIKRPASAHPGESGVVSAYGYDETSVHNAITREIVQMESRAKLDWQRIPAHFVVNLWREYLRKFKFSELFNATTASGLQTIEKMINERLQNEQVDELDDTTGMRTGKNQQSQEYIQLKMRGLEVLQVRIHDVMFDDAIHEQYINSWQGEWQKMAKKEEEQIKMMEKLIETHAREDARRLFIKTITQGYAGSPTHSSDEFDMLRRLLQPIKDSIVSEETEHSKVESVLRKTENVWKWILGNIPSPGGKEAGKQ